MCKAMPIHRLNVKGFLERSMELLHIHIVCVKGIDTLSFCVGSNLDIEAKTSMLVGSHLDQDQIIMWDNSI